MGINKKAIEELIEKLAEIAGALDDASNNLNGVGLDVEALMDEVEELKGNLEIELEESI